VLFILEVKPDTGEPGNLPSSVLGSMGQEARTCPVCGTKFFATVDSGYCPVCILRGANSGESAATGEPSSVSGSAESPRETEGASQPRRFDFAEKRALQGDVESDCLFGNFLDLVATIRAGGPHRCALCQKRSPKFALLFVGCYVLNAYQ
jgi:hypothetical protein